MRADSDCECSSRVTAARLLTPMNREGLPHSTAWESAAPVRFCSDWQGRQPDPHRETEVRLLWSQEFLFLRFRARYVEIHVFPEANTRRDQLWLRDVAEVFIQSETDGPRHYREFEISPYGKDSQPTRKFAAVGQLESAISRNLGRQQPRGSLDPLSGRA